MRGNLVLVCAGVLCILASTTPLGATGTREDAGQVDNDRQCALLFGSRIDLARKSADEIVSPEFPERYASECAVQRYNLEQMLRSYGILRQMLLVCPREFLADNFPDGETSEHEEIEAQMRKVTEACQIVSR
jgi:hypothetical protein